MGRVVFFLFLFSAYHVFAFGSSGCFAACEDMRGMWGYRNCLIQCQQVTSSPKYYQGSFAGQECRPDLSNCEKGYQCKFSNWGPTSPIFRCKTEDNSHRY